MWTSYTVAFVWWSHLTTPTPTHFAGLDGASVRVCGALWSPPVCNDRCPCCVHCPHSSAWPTPQSDNLVSPYHDNSGLSWTVSTPVKGIAEPVERHGVLQILICAPVVRPKRGYTSSNPAPLRLSQLHSADGAAIAWLTNYGSHTQEEEEEVWPNETLTTGKLLWSNSWIVQTLGQWIQDCRTSRREGVTTEGAAVDTVLRRRLCFLSEAPRTGIGTWLSFPLFSVMMDGAVPANHLYQRRPFRAIASSASLLLWYMDEADCALVFLLI